MFSAETHTPNVVTAVLGDYRSFDTLIETAVVVTGAVVCLLALRRWPLGAAAPRPSVAGQLVQVRFSDEPPALGERGSVGEVLNFHKPECFGTLRFA